MANRRWGFPDACRCGCFCRQCFPARNRLFLFRQDHARSLAAVAYRRATKAVLSRLEDVEKELSTRLLEAAQLRIENEKKALQAKIDELEKAAKELRQAQMKPQVESKPKWWHRFKI